MSETSQQQHKQHITLPSSSLELTPEEYMEGRVVHKLNTYNKLGRQAKSWYYTTSIIAMIGSLCVPVVIEAGLPKIVATTLSLVVAIVVGMEKLFLFREHWRNYSLVAAKLGEEQLCFQTRSGVYSKVQDDKVQNDEEAFHLLSIRVRDIIQDERNDTIQTRTQDARK